MSKKRTTTCRRLEASIRCWIRPEAPKIHRDLFRHSLPDPAPVESSDILDLILQLILLLLEEFKPDNGDNDDNGESNFPDLAAETRSLAHEHVHHATLLQTAGIFADTITRTINALRRDGLVTLRQAREAIRQANHDVLERNAHEWSTWNDKIRNILDSHADAGELKQLSSYLDAWTQIAKGLKEIK